MVPIDTPPSKSKAEAGSIRTTRKILLPLFTTYGLRTLALLYGLVVIVLFAMRAVYEGFFVNKPSKSFWQQLEKRKLGLRRDNSLANLGHSTHGYWHVR